MSMRSPQQPEAFGRNGAYKVVGVIGRGGFATVYKAYHAALDRHVAIKVLRPEMVEPEGARNRFQIEARASARLAGHPNIVTVYDYGEEDGSAYLVLQLVEGLTLEKRLHSPISALEIDRIITGVGSALDFAHRNNLIHRDIKPSNVLLDTDGHPVLSDFGIAKLLDATASMTNTLLGTPDYMSPEQITGAPLDARSDVYALGVMLYRIFAGKTPYQGVPMSILHQHVHAPVPPISTPERPVPAAVEQVIQRSLAKHPEDRPASAGQLASELRAALKPLILVDQAQEALRARDVTRAEGLAAELLRDHPSFPKGTEIQREAARLRARLAERAQLAALIDAQNWLAAVQEIDRLGARTDDEPSMQELVRKADAGLAQLRARQEAAHRAEQERRRQEAQAAERRRLEALEAERREHEAREAARREWEAREAARKEQEAREAARKEQEARDAARREQEARDAARRAWEAAEVERREQARAEQTRLERERQQAAERERERQERDRREREQRERQQAAEATRALERTDVPAAPDSGRHRPPQGAPDSGRHQPPQGAPDSGRHQPPPGTPDSGRLRQPQTAPDSGRHWPPQTPSPAGSPDDRQRQLTRLAKMEALERQVDEEEGYTPAEVEQRAAERRQRAVAQGLVPADASGSGTRSSSRGVAVIVGVVALVVVLGGGALLMPGMLPTVLGTDSPAATATTGTTANGPTRVPTVVAQGVTTPAPAATNTAVAKPDPTPTTAQQQAKPETPPTSAPKPTEPPAKPTEPPAQPTTPPTQAPPPLPPTIVGKDDAEMLLVAGGRFLMGEDGDASTGPKHPLDVPPFYLDKTEVTNARFQAYVTSAGAKPRGDWRAFFDAKNFDPKFYDVERGEHPVVNVTWEDAKNYCEWAGKRLPTEAEWEKGARGDDGRRWPWGNEPHPEYANVENNTEGEPDTKRVGSFPRGASPSGLLDMTGNVREWTASSLQPYPLKDPFDGMNSGGSRVTRGGSWLSLPTSIEVTRRLAEPVDIAAKDLGFRCAVSADQAPRR